MENLTLRGQYYLTQAQYEREKGAGNLIPGAIYHITDIEYLEKKDYIVDDALSSTSQNPIQNEAVYEALQQTTSDIKQYVDENGGKIDKIQINGVDQPIVDKTVNINVDSIGQFSNTQLGTIRGSEESGKVSAEADGTGSVNGWQDILTRLDNLEYVPITINSFTSTQTTPVEIGSSVADLTFNWTINKASANIASLILDGKEIDTTLKTSILTGPFTANKTVTLKATDDKNATSSKSWSLNFYPNLYYGIATKITTSAEVIALSKQLKSSKAFTFTVNAAEENYIFYCLPTSYGTPTFNVGGFDGGFTKQETISVTNASGYTQNYDVWKSDNAGLGSTTVVVK